MVDQSVVLKRVFEKLKTSSWRYFVLIAGAFLCLALYAYRLSFPSQPYYDEPQFLGPARAHLMLQNNMALEAHPFLGKLMIALSLLTLGDRPFAWRFISLLCGWGAVLIMYAFAKRLMKNYWMPLLAAYLFAIEGINIVLSRVAMIHIQMLLWMLLSLFTLAPYLTQASHARSRSFFASGLCLGLGISTRWIAFGLYPMIAVLLLYKFLAEKNKLAFLRDAFIFFLLMPGLIYFGSYLILPLAEGKPWADIWKFQLHLIRYHSNLVEGHIYASAWWGWPLLIRPIWFFYQPHAGPINGIICMGNPAIYWMIPFAMAYVLFKFIEEKKFIYGFILLGFFSQWLLWAWIWAKHVKFFYYFAPPMIFAVMAIALLAERIWRIGKLGQGIVISYVILVTALFIYWYPLLTGYPISEAYFRHHMWFRTWI